MAAGGWSRREELCRLGLAPVTHVERAIVADVQTRWGLSRASQRTSTPHRNWFSLASSGAILQPQPRLHSAASKDCLLRRVVTRRLERRPIFSWTQMDRRREKRHDAWDRLGKGFECQSNGHRGNGTAAAGRLWEHPPRDVFHRSKRLTQPARKVRARCWMKCEPWRSRSAYLLNYCFIPDAHPATAIIEVANSQGWDLQRLRLTKAAT